MERSARAAPRGPPAARAAMANTAADSMSSRAASEAERDRPERRRCSRRGLQAGWSGRGRPTPAASSAVAKSSRPRRRACRSPSAALRSKPSARSGSRKASWAWASHAMAAGLAKAAEAPGASGPPDRPSMKPDSCPGSAQWAIKAMASSRLAKVSSQGAWSTRWERSARVAGSINAMAWALRAASSQASSASSGQAAQAAAAKAPSRRPSSGRRWDGSGCVAQSAPPAMEQHAMRACLAMGSSGMGGLP